MIRDLAVARVQRILGWRSDKATEIIEELQNAQVFYEKAPRLPWFLLDETHWATLTDGEERIPVPSDFLREYEKGTLWYYNATATEDADIYTNLVKDDLDYLRDTLPGEGAPVAYALTGDYFRIFPTPDDAYVLRMVYYKKGTVLSTNVENDWLLNVPDVLIGYAGRMIAAALHDDRAKAAFTELEALGSRQMVVATEAREHENVRYIMGGPD